MPLFSKLLADNDTEDIQRAVSLNSKRSCLAEHRAGTQEAKLELSPHDQALQLTSGSPLLGAGSNCRNFLFMLSFTSMIAAMFPEDRQDWSERKHVGFSMQGRPVKSLGLSTKGLLQAAVYTGQKLLCTLAKQRVCAEHPQCVEHSF